MNIIYIRVAGSSIVLDARGSGAPTFVHWGADLGDLQPSQLEAMITALVPAVAPSSPDVPLLLSVLPSIDEGWEGHPALGGRFADGSPMLPVRLDSIDSDGARASIRLSAGELVVELDYLLTEEGLLRASASLTNNGTVPFHLAELNVVMPVPHRATEVLDFAGRWSGERAPQRRTLQFESITREIRHGRPGHDSPFVFAAGTPGFDFRSGEIWATHLAWSGNQRVWAERPGTSQPVLGLGELLAPGEITLQPGETYSAPPVFGSWSPNGLDTVSARFHAYLRRTRALSTRRHPVILNTWEAVYFDHDETKLRALADVAARVGVERFVLDDGWMSGRIDDRRGLGDWTIDAARRPQGLAPLIDYVRSLGMDFGLWVEPEMLNLESDVAREHPDWVRQLRDNPRALTARHQFTIDLANPAAFDHVLGQLDALLTDHSISYLKWDHNRDLLTEGGHEQTAAIYRLLDELERRHPDVEIESCASGGGRIDLGMLERTTRVWPSDTNDSLERQRIYRWTSTLIPPEVFGAHLGAPTAHITGRTHSLSFRMATALFGWVGLEWDLTTVDEPDLAAIGTWIAAYKQLRGALHSGAIVRADRSDDVWVHGVVAQSDAVYAIVAMEQARATVSEPIRFPGLDPDETYDLTIVDLGALPHFIAAQLPEWMSGSGIRMSGRLFGEVGIAAPPLAPEQAIIVRLTKRSDVDPE